VTSRDRTPAHSARFVAFARLHAANSSFYGDLALRCDTFELDRRTSADFHRPFDALYDDSIFSDDDQNPFPTLPRFLTIVLTIWPTRS
jgi:hypothetical protein